MFNIFFSYTKYWYSV